MSAGLVFAEKCVCVCVCVCVLDTAHCLQGISSLEWEKAIYQNYTNKPKRIRNKARTGRRSGPRMLSTVTHFSKWTTSGKSSVNLRISNLVWGECMFFRQK